jgi:excisionase family DNA binding protein
MTEQQRNALFVRLTPEQARRLDRAVTAVPARKKDLIGGLVERFVHPDTPSGVQALRELAGLDAGAPRKVTLEVGAEGPVVGHASFRPGPEPQVLDAAGAAELLRVDEAAVVELAERGEIPARRIGEAWRFSRRALLDWLAP